MIRRKIFRDVVGQIRREPIFRLPVEIMRGISRIGDVNRVDAAGLLLRDPLIDPLGAGALDVDHDAGVLGFERLAEVFGDVQFKRGIVGDVTLSAGSFDQLRRHRCWRRCSRPCRLGEQRAGRKRGGGLKHIAP